ncbi:MAG: glutamate-1-semialdehyde 2,1-aminomutase [Desulfosudaceae bacterium]
MKHEQSEGLFAKAAAIIPGGVNSPVRSGKSVGAAPLFIDRARGSRIVDADDNQYIDYIGSWGPMIVGHRHPEVMKAVAAALERGLSFGASTDLEVELAAMIIEAVPSLEMVRMVNSGTEATMSAVRLARAVTGRNVVVKFDGCYHGHADTLLVDAGSGVATQGIPGSPGVPSDVIKNTLSLPYNDNQAVQQLFAERGAEIAAVIVEPVAGNMGLVPPEPGFLETLRTVTSQAGSLLIFDEVMSGFRVAYGGAQEFYGVLPDITCLGKIIGGGMPVGAYGASREIMSHIAPEGNVYQAGTLSGNPVAMAAGLATLRELQTVGVYGDLQGKSEQLVTGLGAAAEKAGLKVRINAVGAMLGMFFADQPVTDFVSAKASDLDRFSAWYRGMLERGIYLAPSQFEAVFISTAHTEKDIEETIRAAGEVMEKLAG